MASKAWKDLEREVAHVLGGTRRVRINYAESCEDVIHPTLAIECKYGSQVPAYPLDDLPCSDGRFVFIPKHFLHFIEQCVGMNEFYKKDRVKGWKFFEDGLEQARSYNKDKTPVLCVKKPRTRGFILIMYQADYLAFIKRLSARPLWARQTLGLARGTGTLPGLDQQRS